MKFSFGKDWQRIIQNVRRDGGARMKESISKKILRMKAPPSNPDYVLEDEWDNLIVLDACRFDFFEEVNNIEGVLKKKISPGSMTPEWLQRNFPSEYSDICYISSNPWVNKADVTYHSGRGIEYNARDHFPDIVPAYDVKGDKNVPKPSYVAEKAVGQLRNKDKSRNIVHFMQPHTPFIGEYQLSQSKKGYQSLKEEGYTDEEIRNAYRSNLKLVLDAVKNDLTPYLEGKTVVTSDHGEMLGEYGIYGHEYGLYLKQLLEVPWLVVDNDKIKQKGKTNSLEEIEF